MNRALGTHVASRWIAAALAILWMSGASAPRAIAQPCEAGVWVPLTPSTSPPAEEYGEMVYDSARQLVVANMRSGTWEWNGENWALRATGGPHGVMAYDTVRLHTFLLNTLGETWTWNGNQWDRIALGGPQEQDSMAFDSNRGVGVMFAGWPNRATWEWDGSNWALRAQITKPDAYFPHEGTEMCYDPSSRKSIMQGGLLSGQQTIGVTYAWDGVEWVFEYGSPLRSNAGLAFDSSRGRRILYGGWYMVTRFEFVAFGDTYEATAETPWHLVDDTGPGRRAHQMMTFDAARGETVLFGGSGYDQQPVDGFTWVRRPIVLERPAIVNQPQDSLVPRGSEATFTVDATGDQLRFQWLRNQVAIHDSPGIAGTQTSVLTISDADLDDEGAYRVIVSNPCEFITSDAATLKIINPCAADFNDNWVLNSQDYFDFLVAFFELRPEADFDESGTVDSADFFAYVNAFFSGCA